MIKNEENHSNFDSYTGEEEEEEDGDTISFSNLPILAEDDQEINKNSTIKKIQSSSPEDPFEFFNNLLFQEPFPTTPKVIICKQNEPDHQEHIVKLSSSSSSSSSSNSNRRNSNPYYYKKNTCSSISNVQKVNNITSLTSMSSKSRRIMFMFGPIKFNPEMELSSIKMRQSKRALPDNLVAQAAAAGELAIASGGGRFWKSSEWGLMRSLSRYRSRAAVDSPANSCGCFS